MKRAVAQAQVEALYSSYIVCPVCFGELASIFVMLQHVKTDDLCEKVDLTNSEYGCLVFVLSHLCQSSMAYLRGVLRDYSASDAVLIGVANLSRRVYDTTYPRLEGLESWLGFLHSPSCLQEAMGSGSGSRCRRPGPNGLLAGFGPRPTVLGQDR